MTKHYPTLFDPQKLITVLDERRAMQRLTERALAQRLSMSASTFSRLRDGRGIDVDNLIVLLAWLGTPLSRFSRGAVAEDVITSPIDQLRDLLYAEFDPEVAQAVLVLLSKAPRR